MCIRDRSNPIHIIATTTCINLNNQLQNNVSKAMPSLWKNIPTNKIIAIAREACIVFGKEDNKLLMILKLYTKFRLFLSFNI